MATKAKVQQFVLLPSQGIQTSATANPETIAFLRSLHTVTTTPGRPADGGERKSQLKVRVLDSVRDNGAKLVELSPQEALALRAEQPGVRLVPVVYYSPALAPRPTVVSRVKVAATRAAGTKIVVKILSAKDGTAIANVTVAAFTDFASRVGAGGTTNSKGEVSLALGASSRKIQRLYMYA